MFNVCVFLSVLWLKQHYLNYIKKKEKRKKKKKEKEVPVPIVSEPMSVTWILVSFPTCCKRKKKIEVYRGKKHKKLK